jgi:hypothetical protein
LVLPAELPSFNHGIWHFFYMENRPLARLVSRKVFSLDLNTFLERPVPDSTFLQDLDSAF